MKIVITAMLALSFLAPPPVCGQERPAPTIGLHAAALQGNVEAVRQHIEAGTDLNVLCGLCVGHDAVFSIVSQAPVTTLIAKDRVLAHNPIGALQLADSYFARVWGPDKPATPPKIPAEGRRKVPVS